MTRLIASPILNARPPVQCAAELTKVEEKTFQRIPRKRLIKIFRRVYQVRWSVTSVNGFVRSPPI